MKQGKSMSDLMDRIREVSREFGVNVLVAYDAQKPAAPVLNKREIRIVEAARDAENREGYSYLSNAQNVVSGNYGLGFIDGALWAINDEHEQE